MIILGCSQAKWNNPMLNLDSFPRVFETLGYTYQEKTTPSGMTTFLLNDRWGTPTTFTYAEEYNEIWMQHLILDSTSISSDLLSAINKQLEVAFAEIDKNGDLIFEYSMPVTTEAEIINGVNHFHNDIRNITNPLGFLPAFWEDPKCVCYFSGEDIFGRIVFTQISMPLEGTSLWTSVWTQSGSSAADGYSETLEHAHESIDAATEYLADYFSVNLSQVMFKRPGDD